MRLGVDFGTSATVGMVQRPDGSVTPLLFDASPLLPSSVFIGPDATPLVGADAERAALAYPAGLEPHPKRRVDDETTWLGEREIAVVDLIAAVLGRVWSEACRVCGAPPTDVVVTHPATWARTRLGRLAAAAERAGMPPVTFVPEPVAAAAYFAAILGREVAPGRDLVVYDLGAGTFDLSMVRRTASGFEVFAAGGLADVGGLDLDAVVVDHARSLTDQAGAGWARLDWPDTSADHRARRDLWLGVRAAKELLSRHTWADLHVPLVDIDVHLTRDEFETAARPHLDRTVATTLEILRSAKALRENVAGVFLVGGSSRIPLITALLHRQLQIAPTVIDQPELVVAHGCLYAAAGRPIAPPVAPAPIALPRPPAETAPRIPPAVNGIPPRGVLPRDFPVHLVEVAIGDRVGYAVRTYVTDDEGDTSAVFASEGSRLPLFPRPEQAGDYAVGTDDHAMTSVLHWEALRDSMALAFLPLIPENRYHLDMPAVTLERKPKDWLIELVINAGDLARELSYALDIPEGQDLLGPGTLLDRADDALRVAQRTPFRLHGRRDLRAFDQAQLVAAWRRVAAVIDAQLDWRD
ncbi:Hsp70 family protein [Cryptosporangium aurantiacum]|uniref:Hsp70 protein n=1 Tax=Cryptosporangium aurantiacum TaxID=134849 RepID=A0A1M7RMQ4_9ACTN|nr:Hsp70 family protein [Cryptosporangium aurantiacum]SHN47368.1 Hsp70 protein [Cryptosporangium aurantiacum]